MEWKSSRNKEEKKNSALWEKKKEKKYAAVKEQLTKNLIEMLETPEHYV